MRTIDARGARSLLYGPGEAAMIDVREAGQFGEGHPLFAVPCAYSVLEARIGGLVPRHDVPLVLVDAGDGVAERAAARLGATGYADVRVLAGGMPAWEASGSTVYRGINVPSKVLGELYEHAVHVPTMDARALADWRAQGRDFLFFDARPAGEYGRMRVPGSVCLPNGELAHRFDAVVRNSDTPVLVTCAGRTRGLTGVAGLRLAGVPNPVYALENGTQGWQLEGFDLERGNEATPFPDADEAALRASGGRARALAEREGLAWIGAGELARLAKDVERTLYLFDVRSAPEYATGHAARAVHAPAGQLVQATDQWIGVRRARVVLCDDTGLRAALTAYWLRQLGCEPYILDGIDRPETRQRTDAALAARAGVRMPVPEPPADIAAREAHALTERGSARILDLRPSRDHNAARIPGSTWTIRPRIYRALAGHGGTAILVADDPATAALAAIDAREAGADEVTTIDGGFAAWQAAGLPVERAGQAVADKAAIDYLFFVHDRHDGNLDASRQYLAWEVGLIDQLDPQERAQFRVPSPWLAK